MEFILDAPVVAWQIAFALISLFIPVLIIMKICKITIGSGRKTVRSIRN